MDPSVGEKKYEMEGPNPEIWFALQVALIRLIHLNWFSKDF